MKAFIVFMMLAASCAAQIGGGIQQPPSDSSFVGVLSIAKGGSGATNAAAARSAFGVSFSRWYSAADLLYLDTTTGGLKSTQSANGDNLSPMSAQSVIVPDGTSSQFNLPIDWRINGEVKVVSYWTDRNVTNSTGTSANIFINTRPRALTVSNNATSNPVVFGTASTNIVTINYGGSGLGKTYVVEQTVNFGTITNITSTNPLQVKMITLERLANDASDTSTTNVNLTAVHVYVP